MILARGEGASVHNDVVRGANAFTASRADCIFVLGKMRLKTISRTARDIDGPLNIMDGDARPPVGEPEAAGVKRVTVYAIPARSVSPRSSCPTPCLTTR